MAEISISYSVPPSVVPLPFKICSNVLVKAFGANELLELLELLLCELLDLLLELCELLELLELLD